MAKKKGNGEGSITRHKQSELYMARYTVHTSTGSKRKTTSTPRSRVRNARKRDPCDNSGHLFPCAADHARQRGKGHGRGVFVARWCKNWCSSPSFRARGLSFPAYC
jgi:hypothetical protein